MKILYNKFKAKSRNYLVTSAMYGGQGANKYNAGVSCQYMDYVHLMTYDLNDPKISTHLTALRTRKGATDYPYYTNISAESTVEHYVAQGVPKEKLVIGGAFYGKRYDLAAEGNEFLYQRPTKDAYTVTYRNIKNDVLSKIDSNDSSIKVIRKWDQFAQAPYLCIYFYNADGSVRERAFITYDDKESIKLKTEYVVSEGLGGIMFWQLSEEDRTSNDLVGAIYEGLGN
jgi:chitinase